MKTFSTKTDLRSGKTRYISELLSSVLCVSVVIFVPLHHFITSGGSTLGPGGTGPPNLAQPPSKFLDTVVLLLVELIGSIVNFA